MITYPGNCVESPEFIEFEVEKSKTRDKVVCQFVNDVYKEVGFFCFYRKEFTLNGVKHHAFYSFEERHGCHPLFIVKLDSFGYPVSTLAGYWDPAGDMGSILLQKDTKLPSSVYQWCRDIRDGKIK